MPSTKGKTPFVGLPIWGAQGARRYYPGTLRGIACCTPESAPRRGCAQQQWASKRTPEGVTLSALPHSARLRTAVQAATTSPASTPAAVPIASNSMSIALNTAPINPKTLRHGLR